jgi:enoyl-CoA hydratase/carnithine racemase
MGLLFAPEALNAWPQIQFLWITVRQEGQVLTIQLNRPEKRNAFTPTMVTELALALAYAEQQSSVWCVVLEATGPVFCAGMDLAVFQNPALDKPNTTLPQPIREVTLGEAFAQLNKPSIASVQGAVLAGGFLLIGGCTFVVAVDSVTLALPEVRRGIFPMQVMAALLPILPPRKILDLCLTARQLTANEAYDWGIVTHLCTSETLQESTQQLVETLLEGAPLAIQKGMAALRMLAEVPEKSRPVFLKQQLDQIRFSDDAQEGILAFQEKRKPRWTNR